MKQLVETTGSFMLQSLSTDDVIPFNRPAVVTVDGFIQQRLGLGHIVTLAEVTDEATDSEFEQHWVESKGDAHLAVDSFLAIYGVNYTSQKVVESEKEPQKEPEKAKK